MMFLKRLESVGFKSFAERIKVDFVPGVTAIVGPNGSGKSNITDAIRWVLGEQSARSLRGTRMEDIIFQGSDTRNSLNVAEVTLILDNADKALPVDYNEVSVTRRVYRSGSSEFFINKQPCRLKDIIDLFLDSGLGKEAFSIIGQGQVEEILSSKAEERRTIFEEAAGVLKYKQRKQEAEYKLAETDENLYRINDIIYEIEQQIEPLEQQAKTAEKYLQKREQLKSYEISLLITEIAELHTKWQNLLNELEIEKDVALALKTDIQKRSAKLETDRYQLHELDQTVESLQEQLLHATKTLEQLDGQRQVNVERAKHFAANKTNLEKQLQAAEEQLSIYEKEYFAEQQKLAKMKRANDQLLAEKKALEHKLLTGEDELTYKIEQLKAEYIDLLSEQAAKRNEKQSVAEQEQKLLLQTNRQATEYEKLVAKVNNYEERVNKTKETFAKEADKLSTLEQSIEQKHQQLNEYDQSIEAKKHKLNEGYRILAKEKSRRDMLQEMKEDYQGFFYGVKAILQANEQGKVMNIIGPVVQLIDVPKQFIVAIETVLGAQAQHIVVQNDEAARQAINWLRDTNNGRATFLPLNTIKQRFIPNELFKTLQTYDGFIDIAANVVTTNKAYKPVVEHLMGHIILAKNLKYANEIARLVNYRYRIVTLEGDVVNPGGSMTGGAKQRKNQSLFTRDQDLKNSIAKVNDYEQRIEIFEQSIHKEQIIIDQLKQSIEQKKRALNEQQNLFNDVEKQYRDIQMTYNVTKENLQLFHADLDHSANEQAELKDRKEKLEKTLIDIKQQLESIDKQVKDLTDKQKTFKQHEQTLQENIHQYDIKLAEQEERYKNQREKCHSIHERLTDEREHIAQLKTNLAELAQSQLSDEEQKQLLEHIQKKRQFIDEQTSNIQHLRTKRVEQMQAIEFEERELKEEQKKHEKLNRSIQEKEVKATRYDVALENKLSHLQTEYKITFERASEHYERTENITESKKIVNDIKRAIEQLGTVNLGAIDEYKRITERYEFLTEQKDDLVEAKQSLFDLIADMDEEMKKRFSTTFEQIKQEFAVVFKELFAGGRAELQLTDPKNMLDTGIEIVAQPPGKKLQHLGLLSGGERALTAIALLFAILRVRPVPFCVLDEVEAALDEANVVRFAKYLKMHSKDTQFIVITHRKGTMEEADVLYGVTMQESGVSRLVSVRLEDTKNLVKS